jgi:DNA-binding Lrp family transcriptional regulator
MTGCSAGAHADVGPRALGIGLEALFLIELSKHERGAVDRFMAEVVEISEVRSAAPDLGIRVGVQSRVNQPSAC